MSPAEIEARRAELRAERERLEAEARARREDARVRMDLEAEALEVELARALPDLEAMHGELGAALERVEVRRANGTIAGIAIVKAPPPMVWRRFRNTFEDAKGIKRDEAIETLVRPLLVWPSVGAFEAVAARHPRAWEFAADAIAVLAGAKERETAGKS